MVEPTAPPIIDAIGTVRQGAEARRRPAPSPPARPRPRGHAPSPPRLRPSRPVPTRTLGIALLLAILVMGGVVAAFAPAAGFAEALGLRSTYEGLAFRGVRSETRRARQGDTLLVEGEVVNMTPRTALLPAIRLSVSAGGGDLLQWSVELTRPSLAPGEAVAFRSLIPAPAIAGTVVARLAPRGTPSVDLR